MTVNLQIAAERIFVVLAIAFSNELFETLDVNVRLSPEEREGKRAQETDFAVGEIEVVGNGT